MLTAGDIPVDSGRLPRVVRLELLDSLAEAPSLASAFEASEAAMLPLEGGIAPSSANLGMILPTGQTSVGCYT